MPEPAFSRPVAELPDPWEPSGAIKLDGGLERQKFAPWLTALFGIVLALILFHIVVGPIATIGLLVMAGADVMELMQDLTSGIGQYAKSLLWANTIGQTFALAVPFIIIAGWHARDRFAFLRFRKTDAPTLILSVVGIAGLVPISWWLGNLNASIDMPQWVHTMEESQLALIEQVLEQNLGIVFSLFVMALTPAICEEILFRGYLQRQLERSFGVVAAIIVIGILFGGFHFRFTQIIPLSAIGIYLAYITWRSGSIWPAILVHFVNNAFAVILGKYMSNQEGITLEELEQMDVPVSVLLVAIMVFGATVFLMNKNAEAKLEGVENASSVERFE